MMNPNRGMRTASINDDWLSMSMLAMTQEASLSHFIERGTETSDADPGSASGHRRPHQGLDGRGERLMLLLAPTSLARSHVGAPCLLQVAPRSARESSRPPEPEEAFW